MVNVDERSDASPGFRGSKEEWEREWRADIDRILDSWGDPMTLGVHLWPLSHQMHETIPIFLRRNAYKAMRLVEEGQAAELAPVHWDMIEIERRIQTYELERHSLKRPLMFGTGKWQRRGAEIWANLRACERAMRVLRQLE